MGKLTKIRDKKYSDKAIHITFLEGSDCCVYPRDEVRDRIAKPGYDFTVRSWPGLPKWAYEVLADYKL